MNARARFFSLVLGVVSALTGFGATGVAASYDAATNALARLWGDKFEVAALSGVRAPVSADEWELTGLRDGGCIMLPFDRAWVFQLDLEPFGRMFIRERPVVVFSEDLEDWELYDSPVPAMLVRIGDDDEQQALEALNDDAVPRIVAPPVVAAPKLAQLKANGLQANATADSNTNLYAILISGGWDKLNNGIRFYEDVTNAYTILRNKCKVPKANIFAYSASGDPNAKDYNTSLDSTPAYTTVPFDLDGDGVNEIRGGANDGYYYCITNLAARLTKNDRLVMFVTTHGAPTNFNIRTLAAKLYLWGMDVKDSSYAKKFKSFKCPVAFVQEHCYSGGFADDLAAKANRVILTASNPFESSWGFAHCNCLPYCFNWAIEKERLYSFQDAAMFAITNDWMIEHPMYVETTPRLGYEFRLDAGTTPATNYVEHVLDAGDGYCLSTNFWGRQGDAVWWLPDAFSNYGYHDYWKATKVTNHWQAYYLPFITNTAQLALSTPSGATSFIVKAPLDGKIYGMDFTWTAPYSDKVTFSLDGSYGSGTLLVYNGTTKVTSDGSISQWPTVTFTAKEGVTYTVRVSNNLTGALVTYRLGWKMNKLPMSMLLH